MNDRLLVHVEGQTEETVVNEVIRPYLLQRGYSSVGARLLGNARQRSRRGGIKAWSTVKKEIVNHLRHDPGIIATTMVDYYALPASGERAWPGRDVAVGLNHDDKAPFIEAKLAEDLVKEMSSSFDPRRFVPNLLMHEFEALLFSDCSKFAEGIARRDLLSSLQAIRDQFESPEHINDSPITAPSKRLEALIPKYEKPFLGTLGILEIGLDAVRAACPHFSAWLDRLVEIAA